MKQYNYESKHGLKSIEYRRVRHDFGTIRKLNMSALQRLKTMLIAATPDRYILHIKSTRGHVLIRSLFIATTQANSTLSFGPGD